MLSPPPPASKTISNNDKTKQKQKRHSLRDLRVALGVGRVAHDEDEVEARQDRGL
jgi:hypothetical protein